MSGSNVNGNYSAYPFEHAHSYAQGLTKRELFAAMAMQGLLSSSAIVKALATQAEINDIARIVAEAAADHADQLVTALSKAQP